MDALLQTVTQSVAEDVRELVHAAQLETPPLTEIEPPGSHWEWRLPLGFVSLAAAGALLLAAGAVQWRVQEQKHGARKIRTHLHKKKMHVVPRRPLQN
jgi:hypothetical protein